MHNIIKAKNERLLILLRNFNKCYPNVLLDIIPVSFNSPIDADIVAD